ncbi:MAG: transcriptional repressor LexA [Chromatiales bacterium]|nr:transcriptional repressor LexA [Chromatiales bacterium]
MGDLDRVYAKRQRPEYPQVRESALTAEEAGLVEIPLLGWVAAGQPIDLNEYRRRVRVPPNWVRSNTYALEVRGHSMIDDDIQDGDIIVIEKCEWANNGESVVAMINGETVTLKRFYVEKAGIRLQPANQTMAPIYLRNEEVRILGIVTGVLRKREETLAVRYQGAGARASGGI